MADPVFAADEGELLDVVIEDPRWEPALAPLAARAAAAVWGFAGRQGEIVVMGCDDERIAALNADFRQKPRPTNVLSWPSADPDARPAGQDPVWSEPCDEWGDIAIAFDTCQREAAQQGKSFDDHVTHLLVHAMLHLLGYDHIDPQDGDRMEAIETQILAQLGIADPYATRENAMLDDI